MTITNQKMGDNTKKSESVEQVPANVSNFRFNHNIFYMGLVRKWPLVFIATLTFPHSLPTIYPNKIPPVTNVMKPK